MCAPHPYRRESAWDNLPAPHEMRPKFVRERARKELDPLPSEYAPPEKDVFDPERYTAAEYDRLIRLVKWRVAEADRCCVEWYLVARDETLEWLARHVPLSADGLLVCDQISYMWLAHHADSYLDLNLRM